MISVICYKILGTWYV